MGIASSLSRLADYKRRHGIWATMRRAGVALRRAVFSGHSVLFYCDLATLASPPRPLPDFLSIERKKASAELSPEDLEAMLSFWNPKLARRNMQERFEKGASLWLIRSQGSLAGFSWTVRGRSIAPFFFPLAEDDVQFFDWVVFPQFRGRGIHWFLVTHILHRLKMEGVARAFGDAAEWNQASLSSYKMTPFRRLGVAKKFTFLGRTSVWWGKSRSTGE